MDIWVISFSYYEYAMNIHHEFLCGHMFSLFLIIYLRVKLLGKTGTVWMYNLNAHQECVRVPIFYIPDSIFYCLFNYNHPSEMKWYFSVLLIYISIDG